jgi:integrase/recombinase XerD
MATLTLVLDLRRSTKDNQYPLVFRVYAGKQTRDLATGIKLPANAFNAKRGEVLDDEHNRNIQAIKLQYLQKLNTYTINCNGKENAQELKDFLLNKSSIEYTIFSFWEEQIAILNSIGNVGNANSYKTALSVINKHLNLNKAFSKLTYKDLIELETSLYKRGMSTNGISVYLRAFKAIFNKAINNDIVGYEFYPFRKFKIRRISTTPRVLSKLELKAYFNLQIDKSSTYYKSWLIGKLIFMMRGINLKDLLLSTPANIKSGRLIYRRAKTKKLYSIPLLPEIVELLNEFSPNEISLLGMFQKEELKNKVAFVEVFRQKRKVINAHLKKLGEMIGSNEPITTYVFRYSFSNIAKQLGYSKDLISEALGHNYGNSTTSHYLEQFHQDELDELTMKVIKVVK